MPLFSPFLFVWNHRYFRFWAPLCAMVWGFYVGLQGAMHFYDYQPGPSIRVDADTMLLAEALKTHPQWGQTWDWWIGPWYAQVPYFRPLTMMGFWAQYRLFGENGLLEFEVLHWFYHGLALILLFGFLSQIVGRGRAAFAVALFAAGGNAYVSQITGLDAFNCWKDSPDVWHLSFFTLSSWSFLLFLRREKLVFCFCALFFWFCAVAVKESGYCLPFMLPVLLWHERKIRSHWPYALVFFVLAPLLWAYRWNALGGWGNRTGSNNSWKHRVAVDAIGLPSEWVVGQTLSLALIFVGLLLIWAWRVRECRERRVAGPFLALGAGLALSLWQATRFSDDNLFNTLMVLSLERTWSALPFCVLMFALYVQFFGRRDRAQIFAVGWIAVTFIPLSMQPPTSSHVHYPIAPGWSLFLTCALWALPSSLLVVGKWLKPVPRALLAR